MEQRKERYMVKIGELTSEQPYTLPYIYQNLHTLAHKAYFCEEHLQYLNTSTKSLWGIELTTPAYRIRQEIESLLSANRITRNATVKVELSMDIDGNEILRCGDGTIYAGYVMRSLRPKAVCVHAEMPLSPHPTSATIATRLFADSIAQRKGYHMAIIVERDGGIAIEPCAPLFIIKEYSMLAAGGVRSVEFDIAIQSAQAAGLDIQYRRLKAEDLADADEDIIVDWQGVTALSEIAGRPYMDIIAHKIAKGLEHISK